MNYVLSSCSKLFHVRPVTQGDVYRAETEEIPRIFQVKVFILTWRSLPGCPMTLLGWVKRGSFTAEGCWRVSLSTGRFFMPMRESAGRRRTWSRSFRVTKPTVSHTKAMSSSPRYTTFLPTARPVPSLCGTSSSRRQRWSVAAATSSATRTTSTKRRTLLLLAKVKNSLQQANFFYCFLFENKISLLYFCTCVQYVFSMSWSSSHLLISARVYIISRNLYWP